MSFYPGNGARKLHTHMAVIVLFRPETGEPLEDPLPVSELAVYKDAEANGVQIVALKDLQTYFQY